MTKTEALAVNAVVAYLLGQKRALDALGISPKFDLDVSGQAALLADKAHQTLGAGVNSGLVRGMWSGSEDVLTFLAPARRPN
jgi:hypothetical protein